MKKFENCLFFVIGIIICISCSYNLNDNSYIDSPHLEDLYLYGSTPVTPVEFSPMLISCDKIHDAGKGPSWGDIQIGVTHYIDVLNLLDVNQVSWDHIYGQVKIEYNVMDNDRSTTVPLRTCFINDRIIFISAYEFKKYPSSLHEMILLYDDPDLVEWCYDDFYCRLLVWAEEGIMVDVDIETEDFYQIALFSPIPENELENSWIVAELWYPDLVDYEGEVPEWLLIKDPWGFEGD